jgi:hypothetical protein
LIDPKLINWEVVASMLNITEPEVRRFNLEATAISLGPSNLEGLGARISRRSFPDALASSAKS